MRGGGMCPMKPGNRQFLLKWCQFTQSSGFDRWEKGKVNNAFLLTCRKAFYILTKVVYGYVIESR